jgi:endoglucanase
LDDGRVVDGFQGGASHSEGQGYGMALATAFGDRQTFEAMRRWAERNLALRPDALLAWRWLPDLADPVPDRNNASDGDLFFAWALTRAGLLFGDATLTRRAADIARDLAATCVVPHPDGSGRVLFLPAAEGFVRDGGVIVNPSYYFPRAMRELAVAHGALPLAQAADDGVALIAALAARGPTPDWVLVTPGGAGPAPGLSDASGYEAMRVPLFLIWSGLDTHPAVGRRAQALGAGTGEGGTPTVLDAATGAVREVSAHPGYAALRALEACVTSSRIGAAIPPFTTDQPYYPATLHLMALVVQAEGYPRCLPI